MKTNNSNWCALMATTAISVASMTLMAPTTAFAQSSLNADGLDEIVVTAQRREENQQDVPIAVTTATAKFLDENDVRTIEDLNGAIPGFVAARR